MLLLLLLLQAAASDTQSQSCISFESGAAATSTRFGSAGGIDSRRFLRVCSLHSIGLLTRPPVKLDLVPHAAVALVMTVPNSQAPAVAAAVATGRKLVVRVVWAAPFSEGGTQSDRRRQIIAASPCDVCRLKLRCRYWPANEKNRTRHALSEMGAGAWQMLCGTITKTMHFAVRKDAMYPRERSQT